MASYTKKYGHWQARINWIDVFGKRHYKSKNGFATKTLAKKWAVAQENELNHGIAVDKDISFADYFHHWVQTYKEPKVSKVSMDRYRLAEKDLRKYFGNVSIKEISRSDYQKFISKYGAGHAPSTVQKVNGFIRASIKSAILDDYLTKDFTQGVELIADKSRAWHVEYLSIAEIKRLTKYLADHLTPGYTSSYMILTAIYTGMRKEEIQALMWKDIDFLHSTISISKAYDERTHRFKSTKTESSNRVIKVNRKLLQYLKQLSQNTNGVLIFTNQFGTIPTSNALNSKLRQSLKAVHASKPGFHFHSLRHSHVALLLSHGIDIYAISKRLGHSNINTTANTYAYLIDEYRDKTDQQIIEALSDL